MVLAFIANCTYALESDRQAKVVVQAPLGCVSKLKLNQTECKNGLTIEQGSMLIKSRYGLIQHSKEGVVSVLMKGDQVYMEQLMDDQELMVIKANEINYQKAEEKVYLKGHVSIVSSIGVTTGEDIEFDLKTQEINAQGEDNSQQFKIVIDQKND